MLAVVFVVVLPIVTLNSTSFLLTGIVSASI
ncbi:Uncharacterised protein [Staphylococcus aureus]|nr:Uncharacterised protein [Staphylococcus aureus]CAC6978818.1 Uncharacterised protein [Staphylococcus aureus]